MSIQTLSFQNFPVSFREDGYLHATRIAARFNKRVKDFLKSEQNQEYIAALAESLSKGRIIPLDINQLVIVKHGGNNSGTWLHPKLAVDFARWLDPKFAVWCDEQIEQIISGSLKLEPAIPALTKGSMVLSANDVRRLRTVFLHLPYMLAYFQSTSPAVSRLNNHIVYRTYDRFGDGFLAASLLAKSLNMPMKSGHDVVHELYQ